MSTVSSASSTDEDLAAELRVSVMRLRRRLAAERDPANELSLPQMTVLASLQRFGEQSIGELATREMVQPPSMTRTVNCLERGRLRPAPSARHRRPPGRRLPVRARTARRCWPTVSGATPGWPGGWPS